MLGKDFGDCQLRVKKAMILQAYDKVWHSFRNDLVHGLERIFLKRRF